MSGAAVLISDPDGVDVGTLARFFASERKVPAIDAQREARRAWGFLGRRMDVAAAQALVRSAEAFGIPAVVVEDEEVPSLSEPKSAHGVRFEDDRVVFSVGVPPSPEPIPLSNIKLLSFARLRRDTFVTKTTKEEASLGRKVAGLGILLTTGLPVGLGKTKETQKTVAETEWVLFLDVYGDGVRWRVVPAGFDFSGLGEEKSAVGPDNLRRLLLRLHRLAPSARLTRGARWWVESRPLNTVGYDDASDVDQESRWLLALSGRA